MLESLNIYQTYSVLRLVIFANVSAVSQTKKYTVMRNIGKPIVNAKTKISITKCTTTMHKLSFCACRAGWIDWPKWHTWIKQ